MKIALYIKQPWAPNQVGLGSIYNNLSLSSSPPTKLIINHLPQNQGKKTG